MREHRPSQAKKIDDDPAKLKSLFNRDGPSGACIVILERRPCRPRPAYVSVGSSSSSVDLRGSGPSSFISHSLIASEQTHHPVKACVLDGGTLLSADVQHDAHAQQLRLHSSCGCTAVVVALQLALVDSRPERHIVAHKYLSPTSLMNVAMKRARGIMCTRHSHVRARDPFPGALRGCPA